MPDGTIANNALRDYTTFLDTKYITADPIEWTKTVTTGDNAYRWLAGDNVKFAEPLTYTPDYSVKLDSTWAYPITQNDLDNFAKRLYNIIINHTKVDIDEDEFMRLLKGD